MHFTIEFFKTYFKVIYLTAPLLSGFVFLIIALGLTAGRLEKWKVSDSLYWSFITATTVGYGDIRPAGRLARFLSVMIAFAGLIFTGILIAIALETVSLTFDANTQLDQIRQEIRKQL